MGKKELMVIKKHNGIISLWKFCFCMMIVLFHSYELTATGKSPIFRYGTIGVEFFFLVSGFLLAKSAFKKETEERKEGLGKETFHFIMKKFKAFLPYILFGGIIGLIVQNLCKSMSLYKNVASIWDLFLLRMTGIRCNVVIGQAWYISAMLLSMLILYPLLRKYKQNFIYLLAPIIVLFGFGWLSHNSSNLSGYETWMGFAYKGLIRAFLELTLGCILYAVCQKLKTFNFTKLGKILITFVEIGGFVLTFAYAQFASTSKYDYLMLGVLAISVLLAFSEKTAEFSLCNNKLFFWLERFSLPLYICHIAARNFVRDSSLFAEMTYRYKLPIYLAITLLLSFICMYLINYLQKKNFFWPNIKKSLISESKEKAI